jgi:hypothetical protein
MTDIAGDLRERFDFAVLWFHEKCELDPNSLLDEHATIDLTDDETRDVKILEILRDTIDAIPTALIKETEELRDAWPDSAWGAGRRLRIFSNQRDRIY